MESTDSKQKGIVALTMWLQTFPSFGRKICADEKKANAQELFSIIGTSRLTKIVRLIASEVCGIQQGGDGEENEELSESRVVQIWASLFSLTSRMARPISDEKMSAANMSPSELKLYILSNLLDISVNHPNLEMRRTYIGRILKLSKHVQKRLMAMIELRVKRQKQTPPKATSREVKTPTQYTPSKQKSSNRQSSSDESEDKLRNPRSRTPNRQSFDAHGWCSPTQTREHSIAFQNESNTGYTPTTKRQHVQSPETGFLSPGTMDSPQAIREVVQSLQQKNKDLSHDLALAQKRELEFKTKMDHLKQNHRQEMIRLESASMEREQELRRELEGQCSDLVKKIELLEAGNEIGRKAQEELVKARDELDIVNRHQNEMMEMAERLRKYKDKVAELQDLKDALKREQDAHGRSVEEIVKLDSEVKALQPAKRQLEEYKIRAIEAEVKLVETQDYLRRLEQQAQQATEASDSLFKETVMQKEQMNELVKRINEETQASIEAAGKSVSDGVTEMNPEIQQELVRLRNENLQLRAFAAKRQNDAVETLETRLDDSQRLATKFKEQYLETKESLAATQDQLHDSLARENKLQSEVASRQKESEKLRQEITDILEQKDDLRESLEAMEKARDSLGKENEQFRDEIQALQVKLKETFELGTERLEQLRTITEDLSKISTKLEAEQRRSHDLEESMEAWKSNASEMETFYENSQNELQNAKSQLHKMSEELERKNAEVQNLNDEVEAIHEAKLQLQDQLEQDRQSHNMALQSLEEQFEEERQSNKKALDATREILETKHKQDLTEHSKEMNSLLEEEREKARKTREELQLELVKVAEEKKTLEDDYQKKLQISQKEMDETISRIKQESQAEIDASTKKVRKECDAKTNEIIKKGRGMINETKSILKKEIEAIDQENQNLRGELDERIQEYDDLKASSESRENDLTIKLEQSLAQINDLTSDIDETQERLKILQREYRRVQEENDLYRRQVGGRFGVEGKLQAQFENLQKEYNALLDENRQLKHQNRHSGVDLLGGISEVGQFDGGYNTRGAQSRNTVVQVRREYEEAISALNDEKRELLMKHSAAVADVEKAEKRSWEREQENEKLKAEVTSLKLALQRMELVHDNQNERSVILSPNQSSFFSAREEEDERNRDAAAGMTPPRHSHMIHGTYKKSPSIERAKREKAHLEQNFRNSLSNVRSLSDSPSMSLSDQQFEIPPPPTSVHRLSQKDSSPLEKYPSSEKETQVLSPTRKHEHDSNATSPYHDHRVMMGGSPVKREANHDEVLLGKLNDSFNDGSPLLAKPTSSQNSDRNIQSRQPTRSMFDYMDRDAAAVARGEEGDQSECQQS